MKTDREEDFVSGSFMFLSHIQLIKEKTLQPSDIVVCVAL